MDWLNPIIAKTIRALRVAFYGRMSTDLQKDTSIEDQKREVLKWVTSHGHVLTAEFADFGISGTGLADRPQLMALLQEASQRSTRRFDVVAVHQQSRLSRDISDTHAILKRLEFDGVRFVATADGIDTSNKSVKTIIAVKALQNEQYIDDLRANVKRGIDGQFLNGYWPNPNPPFGYRLVEVPDTTRPPDRRGLLSAEGYRLEIDGAEAAIVRRLFALYLEGNGERAITTILNQECPGYTFEPTKIHRLLRNTTYIGLVLYNKVEVLKHPITGKIVHRKRPFDECLKRADDSLRILDQHTWDLAQKAIEDRARKKTLSPPAAKHLLSCVMKCGHCGDSMRTVAHGFYGCPNSYYKVHRDERRVCHNDTMIKRAAIEALVTERIGHLLRDKIHELVQLVRQRLPLVRQRSATLVHRLETLRQKRTALFETIQNNTLQREARLIVEAEFQTISDDITHLERDAANQGLSQGGHELRYDQAVIEAFLQDLPTALTGHRETGRQLLLELIKEITVIKINSRPLICPLCNKTFVKMNDRHTTTKHGLSLRELIRQFPQVGFSCAVRLSITFNAKGLLTHKDILNLEHTRVCMLQIDDLQPIELSVN